MRSSVKHRIVVAGMASLLFALASLTDRAQDLPRQFRGGVFVTPVPGAPFSAVVEQQIAQDLTDGTVFARKTSAFIARDSRGRIHNEGREVLPATSANKPALLSLHIYDPETRLNTFLSPFTHLARQQALKNPPSTVPPGDWAQRAGPRHFAPNIRDEDLGTSSIEGFEVHGYRRTTLLPGQVSGTGRPLAVTEEYWYSEELRINLLTRRYDPRAGSQIITVKRIDRSEPSFDLFEIPANYKIVDMTPPEAESQDQP
jgi:hypothetical protein